MNDVPGDNPVLLYDGSCGFCSTIVQIVLRRDRLGTVRFAALQSPFAESVIERHPELRGIDSVVWLDAANDQIFTRSAAALRVAAYLGGLWRVALILRLLPGPIRDWAYDVIARHRHFLMRTEPHCLVPAEGVRHRFLATGFPSSVTRPWEDRGMENRYTGVFEQVEGWWIGHAEELPGCNVQERTLEEARESLKEVIRLIVQANRDLARRESEGHDVIREAVAVPVE